MFVYKLTTKALENKISELNSEMKIDLDQGIIEVLNSEKDLIVDIETINSISLVSKIQIAMSKRLAKLNWQVNLLSKGIIG